MFILSLSCSDIVVCCISATITPITAFRKEWIFGAALCRIAPFIAGISLCFSTFTLTAISIDRYMLIRFPMKKPLSHLQAMMVIGVPLFGSQGKNLFSSSVFWPLPSHLQSCSNKNSVLSPTSAENTVPRTGAGMRIRDGCMVQLWSVFSWSFPWSLSAYPILPSP